MKQVVIRKLELMVGYIQDLERFGCASLDAASQRSVNQSACERVYELIVEAAVDVNQELCLESGREIPESYAASFIALEDLGVLTTEEAQELANTTRLRNRLVHDYEDTDRMRIQQEIRRAPEMFSTYIAAIRGYLQEQTKE